MERRNSFRSAQVSSYVQMTVAVYGAKRAGMGGAGNRKLNCRRAQARLDFSFALRYSASQPSGEPTPHLINGDHEQ